MEFTHITKEGLPVRMVNEEYPDGPMVQTRTGRRVIIDIEDLRPINSPEAEDILEGLGLRTAQAGQEEDSLRVTLANWAQAQDNARAALAEGIQAVLDNGDMDIHVRRALGAAMAAAQEELAKFRP